MSVIHAFAPNHTGASNTFPFREPSMMRQESPSPNSSLSSSTFAGAKPPTPTSSPKLRRRTVSGGSDQSLVRQNLDFAGDESRFEAPEANNNRVAPVVQDKRRSAIPEPPPAWRDPPGSEPVSPVAPSRARVDSRAVKRTQSLKEQLVNFFTKNSANSSSSSPSASPTSAADKMERAAVMPGHAPVIRSSRRTSRIPQYTGTISNGTSPSHAPHENGDAQASLYSARHIVSDDVRSSDEHGSICFDVHSSGRGELRVVKDPEASPFRSHPVDRCGVVVPSAPSSKMSHDGPELDNVRQGSPSGPPDYGVPPASKKSAPRVIDFERQTAAEVPQRWTRGGSMRHVQVLPDKKVRREKTASSENLMTAVSDAVDSAAAAVQALSLVPRPPIVKRPSTDSEDNNAAIEAAISNSASLPPRRRGLFPKKSQDAASAYSAHHPRSSPVAIDPAAGRGAASPNNDLNLLDGARPDDSSEGESPTEEQLVHGASDGSEAFQHNGLATPFPSALRSRSNSLDCLGAENPTMPQIRHPSRRVRPSKRSDMPPGSPPKTVSWNLVLDVVNYDKASESSSGSSRRSHRSHRRNRSDGGRSGSAGMIARTTSDERIFDSRKGIGNSTLIAVHESFLEQMTNILKQEMELLEEVKQEKKSITVYREVMQQILVLKANTVRQMQDVLEQHEP